MVNGTIGTGLKGSLSFIGFISYWLLSWLRHVVGDLRAGPYADTHVDWIKLPESSGVSRVFFTSRITLQPS